MLLARQHEFVPRSGEDALHSGQAARQGQGLADKSSAEDRPHGILCNKLTGWAGSLKAVQAQP